MAQTIDPAAVARDAASRQSWREAFEAYEKLDQASLSPEDLERYGEAAWWSGKLGQAIGLRERAYVAYAWPSAAAVGMHDAFFIDEHERILVSTNLQGTEPRYAGPNFPPPCDSALAESTRGDWTPWKGKAPREQLPGDRGSDSPR